jgi:glucose/arabinose dehydrogenase
VVFKSVALDSDYVRNRFIYVLVQSAGNAGVTGRVVRMTVDHNGSKVSSVKEIYSAALGYDESQEAFRRPGGALRAGPDGGLYVGFPETAQTRIPYGVTSPIGKVLKLTREGEAFPGNIPASALDRRVYATGISDPAAFAFQANTSALLIAQRYAGERSSLTVSPMGWNGVSSPAGVSTSSNADIGAGVSAVDRVSSPKWGAWKNAYAVALTEGKKILIVKMTRNGVITNKASLVQGLGVGFSSLAQGPDGRVYVSTAGKQGGDEIWALQAQ